MTPDDPQGLEFLASAMAMASASVDRLSQVPARLAFLFDYDAAAALADQPLREEMRGEGARAVVGALAEELAAAPRLDRERFREVANRGEGPDRAKGEGAVPSDSRRADRARGRARARSRRAGDRSRRRVAGVSGYSDDRRLPRARGGVRARAGGEAA